MLRGYSVQNGFRERERQFVRLALSLPVAVQVYYQPKSMGPKGEYGAPGPDHVPPELDSDPAIPLLLQHGNVDAAMARRCRRAEGRL
eukprot:6058899-Pyramimonas_sp.AAC.1